MNSSRTKEAKLQAYRNRVAVLKSRGDKNVKCPGVVRKLQRKIIKLQNDMGI